VASQNDKLPGKPGAWRRWARLLLPLLVVVLALVAQHEWPVAARRLPVTRGVVERSAKGLGTLESEDRVNVAFTTSGRIRTLLVDQGDTVQAGQVLGTLDVDEVVRQVSIARAGEVLADQATERARADLVRAQVARDAAAKELERGEQLHRAGALAAAMLDGYREHFERTDAELRAASAGVRQAWSNTRVAQAATSLQNRRVDDGVLRSPVDGVVLQRVRAAGDVVANGSVTFAIATTKRLRVRSWIDETALSSLREGGPARVTLRSEPTRSFAARIERIGLEADRQTHEVLVDVELLERPARFAFGQRADVDLVLETRHGVRVPAGACDAQRNVCWVERRGRIGEVAVTFGLFGDDWVEVTAGLDDTQTLLVPVDLNRPLSSGRRVRSP
jgi:RND family efflux transporter MFP subunit